MSATVVLNTIYFPRRDGDPGAPEAVPYVLTEADVIRLLRIEGKEPGRTLQRYRQAGWLKPTQIGTRLRYLLPDVLACLENIQEGIPR
jgi:hypothetical protein